MPQKLNRRQFVAGSTAAAGGVAAGFLVPAYLKGAESNDWANLTGRLIYDGKAPERKKLVVDKDVDCCGKFDIRDESLMVGPDGGLANVFIYVRSRGVRVCPELADTVPKRVTLDNRDCIFKPHCMTIWVDKQEFYIVNSDPVAQNVAFSPLGDVPANIVLPVGGDATWRFRRKQNVPVPIACNYHPWESAYILPREDPYMTVTAADGSFRIPKLPVGELEFQAWQERTGYLDTPQWPKGRFTLTIQPGTNDLGTIKLSPSLFKQK
jgi:hypothetical protein